MPKAEVLLWEQLRRKQLGGFTFRRQHPIRPFIVDFACMAEKLVIEIDGESHTCEDAEIRDAKRTEYLEAQGWSLLRFWNEDIYSNLGGVLEHIEQHLRGGS